MRYVSKMENKLASAITAELMNDIEEFLDLFRNVSDHSCAILAASKIDALLYKAISSRLLPGRDKKKDALLDSDKGLSTFSSRIEAAYRIGIITPQHADALDQLRKI